MVVRTTGGSSRKTALPAGIVSSNGRIEADQIDINTKFAGRLAERLVDEGDMVHAGQVVARMDTKDLEASLKQAEAQELQAQRAIDEARAMQEQQQTQVELAQQQLDRTSYLFQRGNATQELLDQRRQQLNGATAALHAATARVLQAEHALTAAQHQIELLTVNIADNSLVAPRDGRIQYRSRQCRRGAAGRRHGSHHDRHFIGLHGHLPADRGGRAGQDRDRRAHRARCLSEHRDPGEGIVRRNPVAVHAQDGRDPDRARAADVPDPSAHRSRVAAGARGGRAQPVFQASPMCVSIRTWNGRRGCNGPWGHERARSARSPASTTSRIGTVPPARSNAITLDIPSGCTVGLIGPDGVGKSSLLGIIAGARRIQTGRVRVLDGDMANSRHRNAACSRIAYMPQGLGKNLYPDLSVRENIEFFGRLFGQSRDEREWRIAELLESTGLAPFPDRPAKKLSGGMRQKLGLCCALIHDPDLLILDEPTTGVDPLSRRQFWDLIDRMRARRPGMSVIIATAYMEEAERFDWLIAMDAGRVLATGSPAELKAQTKATTIEEAFLALLPEPRRAGRKEFTIPPRRPDDHEAVITARDLTCRFGDFTAVDRVSFTIERGEIFGFLGPNGCGKTTTMKMLTGLLPATAGEAFLLGKPIDAADLNSRNRVGYMSQSFSLYTELTARQNLELHARLFHLPREKAKSRIAELVRRFGLDPYLDQRASELAAGHPPTALARRRHRARARDAHPRRADLGRRSAGPGPVLGAAGRSVAQSERDHLRLDAFHERGRPLRPDLADA